MAEVRRLAEQYRFFHPHLAFPDVFTVPAESDKADNPGTGWSGVFSVVLGNPPWEHAELKEKEWFAVRSCPGLVEFGGHRPLRRRRGAAWPDVLAGPVRPKPRSMLPPPWPAPGGASMSSE